MSKLSILRMLNNFKEEVIEYAKQGAPHVTEDTYKERLSKCNSCQHLKQARCGLCGCVVEQKAKWATSDCPDNKWKKK